MCYYFDDIIKIEDFDFDILLDEKLYKSLISAKPLHISFNKVNRFIGVYDGTRYLVLFGHEKHDAIYNRMRDLIS